MYRWVLWRNKNSEKRYAFVIMSTLDEQSYFFDLVPLDFLRKLVFEK